MTCRGSSGFGSLSVGGRIAQKDVQAAVMSFDDVAELVVREEKDTQINSCVGLKTSFSRTERRNKERNVSWQNGSLHRKPGLDYGIQ